MDSYSTCENNTSVSSFFDKAFAWRLVDLVQFFVHAPTHINQYCILIPQS
jgi:hypothetical protein